MRFPDGIHEAMLPVGRFAWLEAGAAGAPVALCLHGFPDHPRTFEPILGRLVGAGLRVVAPFLRGYAPSPRAGPFDARQLGEDAIALADAVSPRRQVLLVGHDWGAVAAWSAAALAPARFAALVALSVPHPSAFLHNLPRQPQQLLRSWYVAFFQLPAIPERLLRARDFALVFRGTTGGLPPYWEALRSTLRESLPGPLGPYRALRRGLRGPRRVRVPTLFLTGGKDAAIGPEMAEGQARWIDAPYASAVLEADHFLHHERAEEVATRILDFVAATAPALAEGPRQEA